MIPASPSTYGLTSWHCHPAIMTSPHRHLDIELNLPLAGSMTYLHRDQVVTIPTGRLAVFWAAIPHQLLERSPDCDFWVLTIPLELFLSWRLPPALTHQLLLGALLLNPDPSYTPLDALHAARWHLELSTASRSTCLREIEARLWRFAQTPLPQAAPDCSASTTPLHAVEESTAMRLARTLIEHHATPLTISAIAASAGLHPGYAMTCFKRVFGVTMLDYLTQYRIAQALRLLVTTDLTILDIALQSGFGSAGSFYTAFKRHTGQTPRAYRRPTPSPPTLSHS